VHALNRFFDWCAGEPSTEPFDSVALLREPTGNFKCDRFRSTRARISLGIAS